MWPWDFRGPHVFRGPLRGSQITWLEVFRAQGIDKATQISYFYPRTSVVILLRTPSYCQGPHNFKRHGLLGFTRLWSICKETPQFCIWNFDLTQLRPAAVVIDLHTQKKSFEAVGKRRSCILNHQTCALLM